MYPLHPMAQLLWLDLQAGFHGKVFLADVKGEKIFSLPLPFLPFFKDDIRHEF